MWVLASTILKNDKQSIKYTENALSIYEHLDNIATPDRQNLFIAYNNLEDTYSGRQNYPTS